MVVAGVSLLTVASTSYVASGLPVWASRGYVDERLVPIKVALRDVKVLIISNSLDQLDTRKGILRSERLAIDATLAQHVDPTVRQSFNIRLGQITDELASIERRQGELSHRSDDLEKPL